MKRLIGILFLPSVLLIGQNAAPPGSPSKGKQLFVKNGCYECHGFQGQGGTGPRIAPRPPALTYLTSYVRKPMGQMPPYRPNVMSDAELAEVYAYLTSIAEPPPAKSIPLLNQ